MKAPALLFFLAFLCGISTALAQVSKAEQYVLKYYGHALYIPPKAILSTDKVSIPFKRADNLILIDAVVDGVQGTFIFDTGAPHLVLNKKYFSQAPVLASVSGAGITGNITQVYQSRIDQLIIGNITYLDVKTDLIDLRHLEIKKGQPIFGLLGNNLFSSFELVIDYELNQLQVYKLDKKGNKILNDSLAQVIDAQITIPLEINHKVILIGGEVNGKKLKFCLDTGAETNILSQNVSKKVLQNFEIQKVLKVSGASDQQSQAVLGILKSLKVGTTEYDQLQAALMNLDNLSEVYGAYIDGMLGYEFLSKHKSSINFAKQELRVWN